MNARAKSSAIIGTILWDIFAQRRAAFVGLLIGFALAVIIATGCHFIPGSKAVPRGILTGAGVILTALVYGLFNFTHLDRKTGQAGFPTRLFILPVRTHTLVTVPMLAGAAGVALFFAAWWLLVLRQFGIHSIIAWPALVLAVTMICFQATLWSLAAFRTARLLTLSLGGTILATLALVPAIREPDGSLLVPSMVLIAIGIGAYLTAWVTVERQRHSGGHSAGLRRWLDRVRDLAPTRTEPFDSARQAQLWYEMRYAKFLPLATLLIVLIVWITSLIFGPVSPGATLFTGGILMLVPPVIGGAVAIGIWRPDRDLPTLVLIRPVSNAELIYTKGKATALSMFLAWLVLLVFVPMWLLTACDTSAIASAYQALDQTPVPAWLIIGGALAFWMLQSWIVMLRPAWVALCRRPILLGASTTTAALVFLTALIILFNEPSFFTRLGERLVPHLPFIIFLLVLGFIAKLFFAYRIGLRYVARGLVDEEHAGAYLLIWGAATVFTVLVAFGVTAAVHAPNLPDMMIPALGILLALNSVPLVRMLLAVKFFESARHR